MEDAKKYRSRSCTPARKLRDKCAVKDFNLTEFEEISKKLDSGNIPPSSKESNVTAQSQGSSCCETPNSLKSPKIILCMYKKSSRSTPETQVDDDPFFQCNPSQDKPQPISSENSGSHREGKLEGKEDLQNLTKHHLKNKNQKLTDELADLQLELKHLIERIEGPMRRQLCRQQKLSADLETQLAIASSNKSKTSYRREIEFLKRQLLVTNNNINDLVDVNREFKDEIRVLNFKCDQLQNFIVGHKINEGNDEDIH